MIVVKNVVNVAMIFVILVANVVEIAVMNAVNVYRSVLKDHFLSAHFSHFS